MPTGSPLRSPSVASGSAWRPLLALGLIVCGCRLAGFAYAGCALPYYDQWLAEFNNVFLRVAGNTGWEALWSRHNEHLLVTTKLASLIGFALNGYWDVAFLVVVSAVVRALEAAIVCRLFWREAGTEARAVTWVACLLVFAAPISGFNWLCGLQVSFAFAELAMLASIAVVLNWSGWRSGLGLVGGVALGVSSMGSALAIPVTTAVVHLLTRRRREGFLGAWIATLAMVGGYAAWVLQGRANRTAGESLLEHASFALRLLSWPCGQATVGAFAAVAIVVAVTCWWRRGATPAPAGLAAAAGVASFAAANLLLVALNRPTSDFHMRHWETAALLPLGIVGAVVIWAGRGGAARREWIVAGSVVVAYVAVAIPSVADSAAYLRDARANRERAVVFYREVFLRGRMEEEFRRINGRLEAHDYRFFDDPILRFSPDPIAYLNIQRAPIPSLALLGPDILPTRTPSVVARATKRLIEGGAWIAAAGIVLAAVEVVAWRRRGARGP